jgi:hypothetical protein
MKILLFGIRKLRNFDEIIAFYPILLKKIYWFYKHLDKEKDEFLKVKIQFVSEAPDRLQYRRLCH